jgi:hypothetical protein
MKIDTSTWKYFVIGNLFRLESGKVNNASELADGDDIAYIGAKKSDNGIMRYVARDESKVTKGNCVIFICDGQGSIGLANYMESDFMGTVNVVAGYNEALTPNIGLFIATVFSLERKKYSFGRKLKTALASTKMKLPATTDDKPDWQWMELFIDSLHSKPLTTKNVANIGANSLKIDNWKEFYVGELFDSIYKVASYHDDELTSVSIGNKNAIAYVTRTDQDNGVKSLVCDIGLANIESGNAIVIGDTTSTISYQPSPFVAGEHIIAARAGWLNKFTGLFITCLLRQERYRYSYGRAYKLDLIRNTKLKLPVMPDGKPDWQFMENYIKSLPYGDRL